MKRAFGSGKLDLGGNPVVTVGMFDGVHLGHRRVLAEVVARARALGGPSAVVTFDRHPAAVLSPDRAPDLITTLEHRLLLFGHLGLDGALVLEFTEDLSRRPAREFIGDVLAGTLGARELVLGRGASLGHGREKGSRLEAAARECDIEMLWVEPEKSGGHKVSSTEIRRCIADSDLDCAARLLGRQVSVLGRVVPGRRHGRGLGFPTANVDVGREVRPPGGVYATWASAGSGWMRSVSSIGHAPGAAAAEDAPRTVECHIMGFRGELYGRLLEVAFARKLRDQLRFGSDAELSRKIAEDVGLAESILAESRPPGEEVLA